MDRSEQWAKDLALRGVGGLQGIANHPVSAMLVRYWWLSVPAALLLWHRYNERAQKGPVKAFDIAADAGTLLSPMFVLIILSDLYSKNHNSGGTAPSPQLQFPQAQEPQQ